MVRAKFKLNSISRSIMHRYDENKQLVPVEIQTLRFSPVSGGSEENKKFWAASPSGSLELGCVNAAAVAQFELDKEYYLDFTPAE